MSLFITISIFKYLGTLTEYPKLIYSVLNALLFVWIKKLYDNLSLVGPCVEKWLLLKDVIRQTATILHLGASRLV